MLIYFYEFINKIKSTPARRNKVIVVSGILGLVVNLFTWALIYLKFYPAVYNLPEDQSFIPLHYNIYLGVDLFGQWQNIFILPGIGLAIFILNTILALTFYNKKELVSYFFTISAALSEIILLIATIFVILINL